MPTWATAIGLGVGSVAVIAAIVLGWRIVAMGRDFARRLGDVHERCDAQIASARTEIKGALERERDRTAERDKAERALDGATLSLEAARMELAREQAAARRQALQVARLQKAIDDEATPAVVRARLGALLQG